MTQPAPGPALVPPPVAAAQSEVGHYFGDAFVQLPPQQRVEKVIAFYKHKPEQVFAGPFLQYQTLLQLGRLEQLQTGILLELRALRSQAEQSAQGQAQLRQATARTNDLLGQFGRMVDDHLDALNQAWEGGGEPPEDPDDTEPHDLAEDDEDAGVAFVDEDGQPVDLTGPADS